MGVSLKQKVWIVVATNVTWLLTLYTLCHLRAYLAKGLGLIGKRYYHGASIRHGQLLIR